MAQRKPSLDTTIFQQRRQRIAEDFQGDCMVLCSTPEYLRNYDTPYPFRQDTNFFYLTGFEEPESVFVMRPGQTPETILFVRPKDELRETWDGFRYGPQLTKKYFFVDEVYLISELSQKLPELLKTSHKIYYRMNQFLEWDIKILDCIESAKKLSGRTGRGNLPVFDSGEFLGEKRIIKDPIEVEWLSKACEISALAHVETMKFLRPGLNERQIEAFLEFQFKYRLSPRVAYSPIVASGASACTLHYVYNDQECKNGDLVLIDAGAEWNYMNGDITRTLPVNGQFTSIQKEFYNHVLNVEKEILKMVRPGIEFHSMQEKAVQLLTEALVDLKVLKGNVSELIKTQSFKKYYPHGVSHWLGMDTHDAGLYMIEGKSRKLEPNMCFTVEPGLYIPFNDESVPKELRGLGVRIEDNVCVTKEGCVNMTLRAPKEAAEIESIIGSSDLKF